MPSPSRAPSMLSLPRSGRPKEQRGQPTARQHSPSVRSPTLKEKAPSCVRTKFLTYTDRGAPVRAHFVSRTRAVYPLPQLSRSFHPIPPPPSQPGSKKLALVALAGYHVLGARAGPPKLHLRAISSRLPKKRRVSPSARRFLFPVGATRSLSPPRSHPHGQLRLSRRQHHRPMKCLTEGGTHTQRIPKAWPK